MRLVSVIYTLNDEEEKRLEALLPEYTGYVDKRGERPFADWDIERLFRMLMTLESRHDIREKLELEERRQAENREEEQ